MSSFLIRRRRCGRTSLPSALPCFMSHGTGLLDVFSAASKRLLPVDSQRQMRSKVGGVAPVGSLVPLIVKFSLKGSAEWLRERCWRCDGEHSACGRRTAHAPPAPQSFKVQVHQLFVHQRHSGVCSFGAAPLQAHWLAAVKGGGLLKGGGQVFPSPDLQDVLVSSLGPQLLLVPLLLHYL